MKCPNLLLAATVLLVFSCKNAAKEASTEAGTKKDTTIAVQASPAMDSATMMKNWQAYMAPGDMHKMMASWNGTWTATVTMWMTPGAPPTTSISTSINKMTLGGRYQVSSFTGTFNGMPFEGMSTMGYDNTKKVFMSSWVDNMGTGMLNMEGPWDAANQTIDLKGKMLDPSTGKEISAHQTFHVKDPNTQTMMMFAPGSDGKEFKTMEIVFTRKK